MEKEKVERIKHIVLVASGKGGVGKSTVAAGIAISLARAGKKVGLLDADLYGPSVPTMFNLENKQPFTKTIEGKTYLVPFSYQGVKLMSIGFLLNSKQPIIWRGPKASSGISQLLTDTLWGDLDYLILDTPPGTGDIHITLLQNYQLSGVVVVCTPQLLALADVNKAVSMYKDNKIGIPILGVVENMSWFTPSSHPDEKYYIFGKGGGMQLSEDFSIPLIAQLPINEDICEEGKVDHLLEDDSISENFKQIAKNIDLSLSEVELEVT